MPTANPFGFSQSLFEQIIDELPVDGVESHLDLLDTLNKVGVSIDHQLCTRLIRDPETMFSLVKPYLDACKTEAVGKKMLRSIGPDGRIHDGLMQTGGIPAMLRPAVTAGAGHKFLVCTYNERDLRRASHNPENRRRERLNKKASPWKVSAGVKAAIIRLSETIKSDVWVVATSWNELLLEGDEGRVEDFIPIVRQQMLESFTQAYGIDHSCEITVRISGCWD